MIFDSLLKHGQENKIVRRSLQPKLMNVKAVDRRRTSGSLQLTNTWAPRWLAGYPASCWLHQAVVIQCEPALGPQNLEDCRNALILGHLGDALHINLHQYFSPTYQPPGRRHGPPSCQMAVRGEAGTSCTVGWPVLHLVLQIFICIVRSRCFWSADCQNRIRVQIFWLFEGMQAN